jgi:hypothetical protein
MKQLQIIVSVLLALLLAVPAHAGTDGRNLAVTAGNAKRIALVIGNDRYQHVDPLKNAVSDARSMAAALQKAGFAVTFKSDTDLATMKQVVRQFKGNLSGGDEAVFYYSGHGVQLGAANYLLPVDITSNSEEQVRDDAIPLQRLLDDLQDQKVKFALAIIDACRDNPFKGSGRNIGGTRGLAPTSAANGQMIIFSAGTGQQALDKLGQADTNENGVFTRVFLQEMQKPDVEVHQVLRNVRSRVVQLAKSINHDQMPALYDQVEGDFYFYGSGTHVASLEPVSTPIGGGVSLDDIKKQQESREQWEKWQQAMKADFDKIVALKVGVDLRNKAWERFLASYKEKNPFSDEDEKLRTLAQIYIRDAYRVAAIRAGALNIGALNLAEMVPIPNKNYEIGKFDVTQGEWKVVMGNNPSHFSKCGDNCPVENVSWNDVQEFIQKLNAKTGKQYRLPTEAEWEYACYGGSESEYCGSNNLDAVGWYIVNSNKQTHLVGQKQANEYGLYDMSGNVWQWVQDWYDNSYQHRTLRGGSWGNLTENVSAAFRFGDEPSLRYFTFGFRLARTLP